MQKWCNVEIRKFEFKKYPAHVKILYNYAFKPIVIAVSIVLIAISIVLMLKDGLSNDVKILVM